jgi:hypothetical protein
MFHHVPAVATTWMNPGRERMNIKLNSKDRFRVYADYEENNFIDIAQEEYESMSVNAFTSFQYIEIRKKEGQLRIYFFKKKSHKKECQFGWWEDAEVVFALNDTKRNITTTST